MAYSTLYLEKNDSFKIAPVGFSWTTLIFGPIPALIRGDIKMSLLQLVFNILTYGISSLMFCFVYNKIYIEGLISDGYNVVDSSGDTDNILRKSGIIISK